MYTNQIEVMEACNELQYTQYIDWYKDAYSVVTTVQRTLCAMCNRLMSTIRLPIIHHKLPIRRLHLRRWSITRLHSLHQPITRLRPSPLAKRGTASANSQHRKSCQYQLQLHSAWRTTYQSHARLTTNGPLRGLDSCHVTHTGQQESWVLLTSAGNW